MYFNESTGQVASFGDRWKAKHGHTEINQLEAWAVNNGLAAFEGRLKRDAPTKLIILVDNSSAEAGLKKGSSAKFEMNTALRSAQMKYPEDCDVHVAHIAADTNPADSVSRGAKVDQELGSTMGVVGDALARSTLGSRVFTLVQGCVRKRSR